MGSSAWIVFPSSFLLKVISLITIPASFYCFNPRLFAVVPSPSNFICYDPIAPRKWFTHWLLLHRLEASELIFLNLIHDRLVIQYYHFDGLVILKMVLKHKYRWDSHSCVSVEVYHFFIQCALLVLCFLTK